jgi:transposase
VANIPAHKRIYIDETGVQNCLYREYGRARRGVKVWGKISGKRFARCNIIAGKCGKDILAPLEYSGSTNSHIFEWWFSNCLLPQAEPGSYIILDNASFHRKAVLPLLAGNFDCKVIFLPPYSPDFNPLEKFWAALKRRLRKIISRHDSLSDALSECFQV